MTLFACENYVEIIKLKLDENSGVRGYNSRVAEAAGCHSSHLSHVLGGRVHLTPDQALAISDFWELSELESDYFLCLVELERAGTERLRRRLSLKRDDIRREAQRFSGKSVAKDEKPRTELSLADATTYCSHWYYCVIHCLVESKPYRQIDSIASHLNLPTETVRYVLDRLQNMELIRFEDGEWRSVRGVKYTGPDDLLTLMNNSQRLYASYRRELRNSEDLNVTIIGAVRKEDVEAAKLIIRDALKNISIQFNYTPGRETDTSLMICCDVFEI